MKSRVVCHFDGAEVDLYAEKLNSKALPLSAFFPLRQAESMNNAIQEQLAVIDEIIRRRNLIQERINRILDSF